MNILLRVLIQEMPLQEVPESSYGPRKGCEPQLKNIPPRSSNKNIKTEAEVKNIKDRKTKQSVM